MEFKWRCRYIGKLSNQIKLIWKHSHRQKHYRKYILYLETKQKELNISTIYFKQMTRLFNKTQFPSASMISIINHFTIILLTLSQISLYKINSILPELQEHPTVHIRLSGQDCIRGRRSQLFSRFCFLRIQPFKWPLRPPITFGSSFFLRLLIYSAFLGSVFILSTYFLSFLSLHPFSLLPLHSSLSLNSLYFHLFLLLFNISPLSSIILTNIIILFRNL